MNLAGKTARVVILGSGLAFFAAAPAYAATARPVVPAKASAVTRETRALPGSCTSNGAVVCIYANINYSGGFGTFSGTNANWGTDFGSSHGACVADSTAASDNKGGWNDCASSIVNNTSSTFIVYINNNCLAGGPTALEVSEQSDLTFQNTGLSEFNDSLSSDNRGSTPVDC